VKPNHTYLMIIYAGLIVVGLNLYACTGKQDAHPASLLQRELATSLANPNVCPTGDSRDVQQIVDAASSDRVAYLPAGCYRITSTVKIPPCTHLIGSGADKTILYIDPDSFYSPSILRLSGRSGISCVTQISGLALIGVRDTNDTAEDYGLFISNVMDFRVDHSYFEGFGFAGVRVEGASSGVVDHAIFVDNYKRGIDNLGYGVTVYGENHWDAEPQPGGLQAIFVEDSLFVANRHAIAANSGVHYVFRNNQVLHGVEACGVDAHGMGFGSAHGTRYVEIYHNVIEDPVYDWCGIGIRGGAGVIFENTIRDYKNPILLILEWGTPDMYKAEYPALDQIQELYIWDNLITGGPSEPQVDETGVGFIEPGRDYFTEPLPGYVPYVYPHPLASGGPFDLDPWPPINE
jgi:hypothetical protein